jgi:virulence-associated protein VapD
MRKLSNTTVFDKVTFLARHDWNKHGPSLYFGSDEKEYVENTLRHMSRTEFLQAISDAIEERIADIRAEAEQADWERRQGEDL